MHKWILLRVKITSTIIGKYIKVVFLENILEFDVSLIFKIA